MKFAIPLLCAVVLCSAATTQTWEMNGYGDFSKGKLGGLSLTREGKLILGPQVNTLFDSGQAEIWSIAAAPDGSFYLGTGNRGRLYRVDSAGKSSPVWTSDQPEIFAVAVDNKGAVYAATSPDGKVYRIENGKTSEFFSPGAHYIWTLALAPDGSLYVGTGDEGKIFRVTAAGLGSVYYETGQTHVTALAFDAQGRLLAGSEPNGILYRITAAGKAFVLYDSSLPEIRALAAAPDGTVYVAALGGSVAKRVGAASSAGVGAGAPSIPTITTTVTVTDQQGGINAAPRPEPSKPAAAVSPTSTVTAATGTTELTGVDRSALYKIAPDNTVETLWSSKEENIYDLALQGSSIVFLTDAEGRIYKLDNASSPGATLVAQANEGDATRLLASTKGLLASTGNLGKLLRLENGTPASGWFESPVHDAATVARWGRLSWRGSNAGLTFRTRTGNSIRPDSTWSDWSAPIGNPAQASVTSPNARYIQWRAELSSGRGTPEIDNVTVAYLPQNTPPVVRSISVTSVASAGKSATTAASSASYSVTVTDTPDSAPAGTPSQSISRGAGQQLQISWQADDPDGDKLIYNLYFRGEDESQWKLLRANLMETTYTLDGDVLADGRYFFRVTASDRPSNPVNLAREAELVSAPVVIDNTPPIVNVGAPRKNGSVLEIDVNAEDRASSLRRCEYSVDAGPWTPVEAADGVTDSPSESFPIRLEGFPSGEHLISIRVYDAAGNAGLAKVVVR